MGELISSMKKLTDSLTETDQICEKHGTNLLELYGHTACYECQREKKEQTDEEIRQLAMVSWEKSNFEDSRRHTYWRLDRDSIFADRTLKKADFSSFKTDNEELAENKKKALEIAERYKNNEVFNTLLTGIAGTGKSHLAMSVLQKVNDESDPYRSCLFLSIDEFLLEIRSTFRPGSQDDEKAVVDKYAKVDLLVLDDLGAETGFIGTDKVASDFTQRILYHLMNRRQDKSTIITTNLNSKQISAMYDSKVVSRLYKNLGGNIIKFEKSKDRRIVEF